MKCSKCNYEWRERLLAPKACPRCKRYLWNGDAPVPADALKPGNLKRDKRGPKMPEAAIGVKFVETIASKAKLCPRCDGKLSHQGSKYTCTGTCGQVFQEGQV